MLTLVFTPKMSRAPRPVHMTANAADNEYEIWERLLQQWEIARGTHFHWTNGKCKPKGL